MRPSLAIGVLSLLLCCAGASQEPSGLWWSTPEHGEATLHWRYDGRTMVGLRAVVAGATLSTVEPTTGPILEGSVYRTTFRVVWGGDPTEQSVIVVGVAPDGTSKAVRVPKP